MEDGEEALGSGAESQRPCAARLVTPLDCAIGHAPQTPGRSLFLITLGESDGSVDPVAMLQEDVRRLRRLLDVVEAAIPCDDGPSDMRTRKFPVSLHDAQQRVKNAGCDAHLESLKAQVPALGAYLERELESLNCSVRRHCWSPAATRSIERRMATMALVAVDVARWATNGDDL
jgi:hypothetical protein